MGQSVGHTPIGSRTLTPCGSERARPTGIVVLHKLFFRRGDVVRAEHRRQQSGPQIPATRLLVKAQAKLLQHRQQVIENIALSPLVISSRRGAGETVDFQRNALSGGLHLADHAGHVRLNFGSALERLEAEVIQEAIAATSDGAGNGLLRSVQY